MALIAATATTLIYEQELTIANAQQSFNYSQALQYNQIVTDWAVNQLQQDLMNGPVNTSVTSLVDTIPAFYPTTTVTGGQYRGVLLDLQAKFNINNLLTPTTVPGFLNMLKTILPNQQNPTIITNAIINYISAKGKLDPSYDNAYQKAGLHYLPPHRPMLNISELRKVVGMTTSLYQTLTPYITALPKADTKLNINTASLEALTSLESDISIDTAKAITDARPFKMATDISHNPIIKNHGDIASNLTVTSDFFVVRSLVEIDKQQLLTNSYLFRDTGNRTTSVMWQTQGSSE